MYPVRIVIAWRLALGLLLALSTPSWAASHSLEILEQAKQAFRQGQFETALTLYSQAQQRAPSSSIQYNLAVCHYKLKQWPQAEALFQQLYDEDPTHEKAQLNLALTQTKQGKYAQALEHLDWLSLAAESDRIADIAYKNYKLLAAQATQRPPEQQPPETSTSGDWSFSASLGYGTDDNVFSIVEETPTTIDDNFWETNLSAIWYSSQDYDNLWSVELSYYASKYDEASDYDVDVISVGVKRNVGLTDNQRLSFSLVLDETTIDGEGYMRAYDFQAANRHKLTGTDTLKYGIRVKKSDELDPRHYGLAGLSSRLFSYYSKSLGDHTLRLRYRLDIDDKNDSTGRETDSGASTFTSQSASRHTYQGIWDYDTTHWATRAYIQYKTSEYDDPNILSDDTVILRSDDKTQLGVQIAYLFNDEVDLEFEWLKTDNSSTIDSYSYEQTMMTLTLTWQN